MNILRSKNSLNSDPLTQPVATLGADGTRVVLTPFKVVPTDSDKVEGFAGTQVPAEPPKGRFRINITGLPSIVIK